MTSLHSVAHGCAFSEEKQYKVMADILCKNISINTEYGYFEFGAYIVDHIAEFFKLSNPNFDKEGFIDYIIKEYNSAHTGIKGGGIVYSGFNA